MTLWAYLLPVTQGTNVSCEDCNRTVTLPQAKGEIATLKAEAQRIREERDALAEACEQVNACATYVSVHATSIKQRAYY